MMVTATQLHLCDERSEELRTNSTALTPCRGALLISDGNGRRLVSAHRGARRCALDFCRKRYREKVFALALKGIEEAKARDVRYVKLVTLTLPSVVRVPEEWVTFGPHWRAELTGRTRPVAPNSVQAYRYFSERFNVFQAACRRRWQYEYFRVVEEGSRAPYRDKNGVTRVGSERVHYHLLVMTDRYMPQETLSEIAARAGLGKVLDVRAVRSHEKAAGYLAAYASKNGGLVVPARMRFFVMSRAWALAYRSTYRELRSARQQARREAKTTVEYVRDLDIPQTLAQDPTIVDLRDSAGGPERPAEPRPISRGPTRPRSSARLAA